jgi:hypothetical protein
MAERIAKLKIKYTHKSPAIRFSDLYSDLKGCLICMPGRLEHIRAASEILPEIAEIFPNRDIRILLTSNIDPQSHRFIKKFPVIEPRSGDLDKFSLPKKDFINRLTGGGLAITVDMDTNPNFFNAVVSLRSGAPVRTAFDKGEGLPYYNLIIGIPAMDAAPKVSYRAMADILRNFRRYKEN